jgi:ADP-heptose:LPS heptosyltransferase
MDFVIPEEFEKNLKFLLPQWKGQSGKYFVIHSVCNGDKYFRIWELVNYYPVIRFLRLQGYRVFLTGRKSDQSIIDEIMKEWKFNDAGVEEFVDRHLCEVAFLIKHAAGVLTSDTGIMHVARAMRTPVVALFGPTNPLHTGCIGLGNYVQIRNDFKCGPCSDYPKEYEHKQFCISEGKPPACMRSISIEQVINALKVVLNHG